MSKVKRIRQINWCLEEKRILTDYIKENAHILLRKRNDQIPVLLKQQVWLDIQDKLASKGFFRDSSRIREQWKRMKMAAKIAYNNYKTRSETSVLDGSKPPEISEIDLIVINMCGNDFDDNIEEYDRDDEDNSQVSKNVNKFLEQSINKESSFDSVEIIDVEKNVPHYLTNYINMRDNENSCVQDCTPSISTRDIEIISDHTSNNTNIQDDTNIQHRTHQKYNRKRKEKHDQNKLLCELRNQLKRQKENEDNLHNKKMKYEEERLNMLLKEDKRKDHLYGLQMELLEQELRHKEELHRKNMEILDVKIKNDFN